MHPTKEQLRADLRGLRARLRAGDHALRSDSIARRMQRLPEIQRARIVHVFWPIPERSEVDTRPFIAWLYTHKKQIVLPVVLSPGNDVVMEHRLFVGEDALVRNHLGIHEPLESETVSIDEIDVTVVPALGVDRAGNRLGYGRGYYDRFLTSLDAPRVCPVFHDCLLPRIPVEPHDVPIDVIVTEREVIRVRRA